MGKKDEDLPMRRSKSMNFAAGRKSNRGTRSPGRTSPVDGERRHGKHRDRSKDEANMKRSASTLQIPGQEEQRRREADGMSKSRSVQAHLNNYLDERVEDMASSSNIHRSVSVEEYLSVPEKMPDASRPLGAAATSQVEKDFLKAVSKGKAKKVDDILVKDFASSVTAGRNEVSLAEAKDMLRFQHSHLANVQDNLGTSSLHLAAAKNPSVCATLLSYGAQVNAVDRELGETPLHRAARLNRADCVAVLIKAKGDTAARDNAGNTPLHLAARVGYLDVMTELLKGGAHINAKNRKTGRTALHMAASHQKSKSCKLLLSKGADASLTDVDNWTARDLATRQKVIKVFEAHKASGPPGRLERRRSSL